MCHKVSNQPSFRLNSEFSSKARIQWMKMDSCLHQRTLTWSEWNRIDWNLNSAYWFHCYTENKYTACISPIYLNDNFDTADLLLVRDVYKCNQCISIVSNKSCNAVLICVVVDRFWLFFSCIILLINGIWIFFSFKL